MSDTKDLTPRPVLAMITTLDALDTLLTEAAERRGHILRADTGYDDHDELVSGSPAYWHQLAAAEHEVADLYHRLTELALRPSLLYRAAIDAELHWRHEAVRSADYAGERVTA